MKNKLIIGIFIVTLIGPTILWIIVSGFINTENYENRTLASRPELSLATIEDYPQAYEDYYNDHLPFKNEVVNLKMKADYKLFHEIESKKVLLGKDNWLFYKSAGEADLSDEQPIADYQGINIYSEEEMKDIAENITAVESYLERSGIGFSVLICPNKEHIYSEYMPDEIIKVNDVCKVDILVDYLHENIDVPVLYPLDKLMKYKEDYQVYFKYDTHWNDLGGFIGVQEINELYHGIGAKLENYDIAVLENKALNDLGQMLNMPEEFSDDDMYYIENYRPEVNATLEAVSEDGVCHVYKSDASDERTVLVIRDSYGEFLMGHIAKDYQNVIFVHRLGFNQSYIDKYQPDIIVYQIVERATDDMKDMEVMFEVP